MPQALLLQPALKAEGGALSELMGYNQVYTDVQCIHLYIKADIILSTDLASHNTGVAVIE